MGQRTTRNYIQLIIRVISINYSLYIHATICTCYNNYNYVHVKCVYYNYVLHVMCVKKFLQLDHFFNGHKLYSLTVISSNDDLSLMI